MGSVAGTMTEEGRKGGRVRLGKGALRIWAWISSAVAFALPFGCIFDFAYSFRLVRHFELEHRQRLYEQVRKVLRPGGFFVFDAVNAVAAPQNDTKSSQISAYAIPQLQDQAVTAQSSKIDGVSGASYTSYSYVQSLQSAIDAAKVASGVAG